jgi:hypothetical protein
MGFCEVFRFLAFFQFLFLTLRSAGTSLAFSWTTRRNTRNGLSSRFGCILVQIGPKEQYSSEYDNGIADFPGGISSSFQGAGSPRLELHPEEIPPLLMEALQNNDIPDIDAGLNAMWDFAGGNTKYIFEYNRTSFIESAHETANQFPTSFYGVAMYGKSWKMETPLNRVGGSDGWIATQVMKTVSSDGRMRRWQWELRKNRRPPDLGVWLVDSIGSSDRKGNFEADN